MKLFYQEPKPDVQKIHDAVSKGFGIKHPECINGYEGAFLFHIPDVYISDKVAKRIEGDKNTSNELMNMLNRFYKNDYGFVTEFESDCNAETRYLSFSSSWMIGRYSGEFFCGVILETLYDISIFYYPEEDITDVLNEQFAKWCRDHSISGRTISDYRINQLRYVKD